MRFSSSRALAFFAALTVPCAASAEVLFRGNFESGNLTGWQTLNPTKGTRMNINVVTMPVFEGMRAAEVVIHPDDLWPGNNHNRVELHYDAQRTAEGNTMFFSWCFRLPANAQASNDIAYWESAQSYQQSMAFWIEPGGGGTQLSFRTNNPGMTRFTRPITINAWHQIAMQVLWSTNATTGRVNVWLDGEKVVDDVAARTKPDTNAVFIQLGYHRNSAATPVETIYIDNAIEATTLAEVLTTTGMGGAGGAGGAAGAAGASGGGGRGGGPSAGTGGTSAGAAGSPNAGTAGSPTVAGGGGQSGAGGAPATSGSIGIAGAVAAAGAPSAGGSVGVAGTVGSAGAPALAGSIAVAGSVAMAGTASPGGASGSAGMSTGAEDEGCGCRVPGTAKHKPSAVGLLALLFAFAFRLRRRR